MLYIDRFIRCILVVTLCFSIAEFGLAVWLVTLISAPIEVTEIAADGTSQSFVFTPQVPSTVQFLVFCSLWSMLACPTLIAIPFIKRLRSNEKALGIATFVFVAVTEVFWLSAFGAYTVMLGGYISDQDGNIAAVTSFIILPWLGFLILLFIYFLTAFGGLRSERSDCTPIFRNTQQQYRNYPDDNFASSHEITHLHPGQVNKA